MIYVRDWSAPLPNGNSVVCVGNFDGVHRGHQYLLSQARLRARSTGSYLAVVTFFPHTRAILNPAVPVLYLTLPEERAELLERQGVDILAELTFDQAIANLTASEFLDMIAEHLKVLELWVGQGFALGKNREGNTARLRELSVFRGFGVVECPSYLVDGRPVSSTRIRRALSEGNVSSAAQLLGRYHSVKGTVVRGDGRGRLLGIPTANLAYHPLKALPKEGVYAVWAELDGSTPRLRAVANLGTRPTFDKDGIVLEVHIIDFDADLYGRTLTVHFVERLRDEQRFQSMETLVAQIQRDISLARSVLS
jgi:riboflavin kinase/FMN adenylyltransferase